MDNMKIILALDNYSIYAYDNYYLCIPNNNSSFYHLFFGFTLLKLDSLTEEELHNEIRKISDSLNYSYNNAIYVLPIINPDILKDASLENDDRLYNKLLKKYIQPITSDIYNMFLSEKKHISQVIKFIKQNDIDSKIIGWISIKLGSDFIKEITCEDKPVNENEVIEPIDNNITIDYKDDEIWLKKQEDTISDTLKPAVSFGFSSLGFMIMMISIFIIMGVILVYMIVK